MKEKAIKSVEQEKTEEKSSQRQWLKPAFERLSLEEATSSPWTGNGSDGGYYS